MSSSVFHRDLRAAYPSVVSAEGMYLRTESGQRILDAVGGAATVVLGHGVREITDAIARHGSELSFTYGATFTNPWQEQLAEALVAMNPEIAARVYFVSGGSEGVETAVKMARQYHLQCGRPGRHKVIARWQSFHGSTLATLSLSGRPAWREPFLPMLPPAPHIVPPYCYRCPLGHTYPGCGVACADDLERTILMEGPDSIAAFIAEPVIGSTVTAVVPVPEYYRRIREICDRYDVLFIADEVLTGYGRTGRWLAIEHWGVAPDIVVMGKGDQQRLRPARGRAGRPAGGRRVHGGLGHVQPRVHLQRQPVLHVRRPAGAAVRAGPPAVRGGGREGRAAARGARAARRAASRSSATCAGWGCSPAWSSWPTGPPGSRSRSRPASPADRAGGLERGVLILPGVAGANYGQGGDHIHLSPPYIITPAEIDLVAGVLDETLTEIEASL